MKTVVCRKFHKSHVLVCLCFIGCNTVGQRFLYENGILPDMEKLTSDLAYETVHPVKDDSPISTTTLTRSQISSMESSGGTPGKVI